MFFAADKLEAAVAPTVTSMGTITRESIEKTMCAWIHSGVSSHGHAALASWGVDVHKAMFERQILHAPLLGCAGDCS